MGRAARSIVGALAVFGCGPDVVERAELDDVCGEPSPVRLLPLDDGEQLLFNAGAVQQIGERIYFVTGVADDPNETRSSMLGSVPVPSTTTVRSTGPCGEEPRMIAQDILFVREHERWPGVVLGCSLAAFGQQQLVRLDPEGIMPPSLVLPDACGLHAETELGIVVRTDGDDGSIRVVFWAWPEDPGIDRPEPRVLFADLPDPGLWDTASSDVVEVFAVDAERNLLRRVLPNGDAMIEQTNVHEFDVSPDGRWLTWQDTTMTGGTAERPRGAIRLRDRSTGTETYVADASYNSYPQLGDGFLSVAFSDERGAMLRLVDLATLATYDTAFDGVLFGPLANGLWVKYAVFEGPHRVIDLATGRERVLSERNGPSRIGLEWLTVLDRAALASRERGELWRIPYDGSQEQLLAPRAVANWFELADGRIVTPLRVDPSFHGDLVIVDPDTHAQALIDERVFAFVAQHSHYNGIDEDRRLLYGVGDGDRSGVWLARLAARR